MSAPMGGTVLAALSDVSGATGGVAVGGSTLALLTAPLAGCALTRTVVSDLGITPADAVAAYQVAKGIAQVAVLADPALAPIVAAIIAIADPLMARVQAGTASPDALVAQATVLTVRTAGVVKVVAAKSDSVRRDCP